MRSWIILLSLLAAVSAESCSRNCTTLSLYSTPSCWTCGHIPGEGDSVEIIGSQLILDISASATRILLSDSSLSTFNNSQTFSLTAPEIEVKSSNITSQLLISSEKLSLTDVSFDAAEGELSLLSSGEIMGVLNVVNIDTAIDIKGNFTMGGSFSGEGTVRSQNGTITLTHTLLPWSIRRATLDTVDFSRFSSPTLAVSGSLDISTLHLILDSPPNSWSDKTVLFRGKVNITTTIFQGKFDCFNGIIEDDGFNKTFVYNQPNLTLYPDKLEFQRQLSLRWNISEDLGKNDACAGFEPDGYHLYINDKMNMTLLSKNITINESNFISCQPSRIYVTTVFHSAEYATVKLQLTSAVINVFPASPLLDFRPNKTDINISYGHGDSNLTVSWNIRNESMYPCGATLLTEAVSLGIQTKPGRGASTLPIQRIRVGENGSLFWNATECYSYALSYHLHLAVDDFQLNTAESESTIPILFARNSLLTSDTPTSFTTTPTPNGNVTVVINWAEGPPTCACSDQLASGKRMVYIDGNPVTPPIIFNTVTLEDQPSDTSINYTIATVCQYKLRQEGYPQSIFWSLSTPKVKPHSEDKDPEGPDTTKIVLIVFGVLLALCILSAAGVLFYRHRQKKRMGESVPLFKEDDE